MSARGWTLVPQLLVWSCALCMSCGDDGSEDNSQASAAASRPMMCMPSASQACACSGLAGAYGSQVCAADGKSYGACQGCPALSVGGSGSGGGSAGAGSGVVGGTGGSVGGSGGSVGGGGGSSGAGGAAGSAGGVGGGGAGGAGGEDSSSLDVIPAEPGTSCGVGLVSLCPLETEKCCNRSLETDTCIPAGETCSCGLPNCTVMEASCDGPEDCAQGEVCCGTLSSGSSGYDSFECATQCDNQGMQREACHQGMTECPGALECHNSQLLTNVQVCIDPATIMQ